MHTNPNLKVNKRRPCGMLFKINELVFSLITETLAPRSEKVLLISVSGPERTTALVPRWQPGQTSSKKSLSGGAEYQFQSPPNPLCLPVL